MREYLKSRWVRAGLALLVLGSGPLLFIIGAAAVGLWPIRTRTRSVPACCAG
jgi:hypothetical protein